MRALGYFRVDAISQVEGRTKTLVDFHNEFETYCDLYLHQPVRTFGDLNAGSDLIYTPSMSSWSTTSRNRARTSWSPYLTPAIWEAT